MRWILLVCLLSLLPIGSARAQTTGRITGTVTDGAGAPLAGAALNVTGRNLTTLSDAAGHYTFENVPAGTYEVRASRLGFVEQRQSVAISAAATTTVDFRLQAQAIELEGVVAVGYGTQRKRDLTGSVSSIDLDETQQAAMVSVDQVLQGRAAGVQVTRNNGAPGGGISVRIRGTNSISANSQPLYVVDGVPAFIGSGDRGNGRTGLQTNPLAALNPNDIESIEVLKDASATAIYGSRGANGVVLISTKRGVRGQNEVRLQSSYGTQEIMRTIPMLNAEQYAVVINEARANVGLDALYTPDEVADFGEGTNWQDEIFRTAPMQSHALSVSGGDEQTRYLVTGSFLDQDGTLINSGFKRYSARLNLDREVSSRLRIGNSLMVSRTHANQAITDNGIGPGSGVVEGALEFVPTMSVRDEDGNYIMFSGIEPIPNPVATAMEIDNKRSESRLVGNIFGEYDLTDALRFRTSVGGTTYFEREDYFAPSTIAQGLDVNGDASASSLQATEVLNENILTYRRELRDGHDLDLTGGFTVQTFRSELLSGRSQQFATNITGSDDLGAGALPLNPGSGVNEWALLSWLGRANYNLLDRYLFTVTGRYDGSSKFGENNKWGFFPSAAFAWRLSDEPFLRDQSLFSDLKLRASYGATGNQEIGTYNSLAQLNNNAYTLGGQTVVGYVRGGRAPNPDLKWETTRQADIGLDAAFLENRVSVTADYYHSLTSDLLLTVPLPSTTGYSSRLENVGSVRNTGVELSLSTVNVEREGFTWRSTLNLARNRNAVVELGGVDHIFPSGSRFGGTVEGGVASIVQVGEPLGTFYGYQTAGLWQQGDDFDSIDDQYAAPGEWKFVDSNGDGKIDAGDRTLLGNAEADIFGGFTNNFTLGPLSLDVFLQGSFGQQIANASYLRINSGMGSSNLTTAYLDRWTPTNTDGEWPRANLQRPRRMLDVYVEDASFIRLQNLTLGYDLPERLRPGAERAKLYVSGQNLHVWTDYSGYDPEVSSYGGDATMRGFDLGTYPRSRVLNVGVDVTF